ncbi:MAG: transglutaminase family protein [Casimicrobiaceae bacterium]
MTPRVAVAHRTHYAYDRTVSLSPHAIRLRPAPFVRPRIESYALDITPTPDAVHWQEDASGNWIARVVFAEPTRRLDINVRFVASLPAFNPFDFLLADRADEFPFTYADEDRSTLAACLASEPPGPRLAAWLADARARFGSGRPRTVDFLVAMNRAIADVVGYTRRYEQGVQDSEETLGLASGSCRDSGWLLTQALRHCGIAARFVSGYLIQLTDTGAKFDSVDLHAWCEAYVPGAGWIGLDATSGLLTAQGHLPLARAALPASASPVEGYADPSESHLSFDMEVTRLAAHPPADGTSERELHAFRYRDPGSGAWRTAAFPASLPEIQSGYAEFDLIDLPTSMRGDAP